MTCTVVNSQSTLKSQLPPIPGTMPTNQGQWTQFVNTLNQWAQALKQDQHTPNVIPSQFQTFTTAAAPAVIAALTAVNCTPSVSASQQYYGAASLEVVVSSTGATLKFTGTPISIAAATRWFCSFQIYASAGLTGSLAVTTSGSHTLTEAFTVPASASWQQVWGLFDLRAYSDPQATWEFTFNTTGTVYIDGMQMNAVGDPIANLPKFAGTQMVLGPVSYAANLDAIPNGSTYAKTLSTAVNNGIPYTFAGAYSGTVAYVIGQEVSSGGNFYICTAPTTGNAPPNATYWQLVGPGNLSDIAGTVSDAQIAAVAASKVTGQLTDAQLAAIAAAKVTGTITTTQIANNAITTPLINAGAVTSSQIAANTIVAGNIAASTITGTQIAAGTITGAKIAAGTIAASNIVSNTITASQIAANTVTASNIASETITAAQIASNTITASQIAANTITASQVAANTITSTQIASATITGGDIAASTITASNLNVSSLSAITANLGTVTAGEIIFDNGTNMMVQGIGFGASSNLLLWYGPHQASITTCTKSNAYFYLATDGTSCAVKPATTTKYTASTTVTIPAGTNTVTLELWGDTGLGNAGNNTIPTFGGGGGSGGYCRSVYSCIGQAGNTLTLTLQTGASGSNSTITAGTFTGFTTMTAPGGGSGTAATSSVDGVPGTGGATATGGTVINAQGSDGGTSTNVKGGGQPVPGLNGNGNPGGIGTAAAGTTNPGQPAVAVVTYT